MGEIADQMIDGEMCHGCGMFMHDDMPFEHLCPECAREQGLDEGESKAVRIQRSEELFELAAQKAAEAGLTLKRCKPGHYQLTDGKYLINIYPTNRRLYWDRKWAKPPYLNLPANWTLLDVVIAATGKTQKGKKP